MKANAQPLLAQSHTLIDDGKNSDDYEESELLYHDTHSHLLLQSSRSKLDRIGYIDVQQLQVGDVVFVRKDSAVSRSQFCTKLFAKSTTKRGNERSVHCFIITAAVKDYCEIGHVVGGGGTLAFIANPLEGDIAMKQETYEAVVYRLENSEIAESAARAAKSLIDSKSIKFNKGGSVTTVLKSNHVGKYLNNATHGIFQPKLTLKERILGKLKGDDVQKERLELFCSEFVIKSYQQALLDCSEMTGDFMRVINLNGSASTPMAFEGFLRSNNESDGDWSSIGRLQFEYI